MSEFLRAVIVMQSSTAAYVQENRRKGKHVWQAMPACAFLFVVCQLMPVCRAHNSGACAQVDRRPWRSNDNCISLDADVAIDVPKAYSSLDTYRATVGHKANHSFMPNAKYVQVYHARFGYLSKSLSLFGSISSPTTADFFWSARFQVA